MYGGNNMDPRMKTLAENLVNYSAKVQNGEKVLINCVGESPKPLVKAIIKEVQKVGADPFVNVVDPSIERLLAMEASDDHLALRLERDLNFMKKMDAYIGIRGASNVTEMADVPGDKMQEYSSKFMSPVADERVDNTKWVVLRYPNESMAQLANTSVEAFEEFYYQVCNLDYKKMSLAMDNLVELMNKTDKVRITGEGTDLSFSIKDLSAIKCDGEINIPDGEVFTAPVKDSVNGVISYNAPAVYQGFTYENIVLEFENGKIVKATANDTDRINKVFDTDEGARYIGEFAIGVNPYILDPMKDTLFDEKIMGSFHFTPGAAYEEANNGNDSSVHWDLVCIQRPEFGGGEIWFDGVLIRKDGIFVIPELEPLNPENLK